MYFVLNLKLVTIDVIFVISLQIIVPGILPLHCRFISLKFIIKIPFIRAFSVIHQVTIKIECQVS